MTEATRTVLFLGAGASRPFGFPMTAEILPEVLRRLKRRVLFRHARAGRSREGGAATHRELQQLLSRFMPALFEGEAEPPLITDLLSLVDHLLSAGNAPQPDLDLAGLDRLRALLERAIAEVLAEPTVRDRADANEEVLLRFVDWIATTSTSIPRARSSAETAGGRSRTPPPGASRAVSAGTSRCATSSSPPRWSATCAIRTS
jgi:hypothetical protein